jgi:hypothetical protein
MRKDQKETLYFLDLSGFEALAPAWKCGTATPTQSKGAQKTLKSAL